MFQSTVMFGVLVKGELERRQKETGSRFHT